MVTETATISAAMATAVRLSAPVTLRGAMRPSTPKSVFVTGTAPRISSRVTTGRQQREADGDEEDAGEADGQALRRRRDGQQLRSAPSGQRIASSAPPAIRPDRPASRERTPVVPLEPERASASRGGTVAASQAGSAAETTVASDAQHGALDQALDRDHDARAPSPRNRGR